MIAAFALISLLAFGFSDARIDPCLMPIEPGMCMAYMPSWGMDVEKGECVEFIYGGCQGNLNRFPTKEKCESACGHVLAQKMEEDICHLPLEAGNCRGFFKKWGMNPKTGKCEQFIYGGCGGNKNNFDSKEECEEACLNYY